MDPIFFNGWAPLGRTLVIGVLAYASLLLILRASGKRTLSKMNAFDFVVTVALGSTLATVLLNKQVTLAEGALAFAVLVGLQFLITWSSVRARVVRRVVTGEPTLLFFRGAALPDALRRERVTEDELWAAMRASGRERRDTVGAVVLETDGSFTVLPQVDATGHSTLAGVSNPDRAAPGVAC